jgi:hypothetical protein
VPGRVCPVAATWTSKSTLDKGRIPSGSAPSSSVPLLGHPGSCAPWDATASVRHLGEPECGFRARRPGCGFGRGRLGAGARGFRTRRPGCGFWLRPSGCGSARTGSSLVIPATSPLGCTLEGGRSVPLRGEVGRVAGPSVLLRDKVGRVAGRSVLLRGEVADVAAHPLPEPVVCDFALAVHVGGRSQGAAKGQGRPDGRSQGAAKGQGRPDGRSSGGPQCASQGQSRSDAGALSRGARRCNTNAMPRPVRCCA